MSCKKSNNCHHNCNDVITKKEENSNKWYITPFSLFDVLFDYTYLFSRKLKINNMMEFTMNNCMYKCIEIKQNDFREGSYIIQEPGYYKLTENIIFSPNRYKDGKPSEKWLSNIDEKYRKSYVLGFFAAIVIQADNVILDLNGFTIRQSDLFFVQQTFYSHIELASTPFIMGQGPASFGKNEKVASNVIIKNGCLGKSSHHGIHAPGFSKNVLLYDLKIRDFTVAGIHLNGTHNVYIEKVEVDNYHAKAPFNSLFSQAQFILPFLEKIDETETIMLEGKKKTILEIKNQIKKDVQEVYDSVECPYEKTYPKTGVFYNEGKSDANMYGIVLNTNGVAINGFKDIKTDYNTGNNNIVLNNVEVKNISSKGTEIKALTVHEGTDESYGAGALSGPVGDVFDYEKCTTSNGKYKSNCLSDAQIAVATFLTNTRANIPDPIKLWATGTSDETLKEIIDANQYGIVDGKDSMSHVMKGNMGIFCSQVYRMIANNILVENIVNSSTSEKEDVNSSSGILFSGCKDIVIKNYSIGNLFSHSGVARHFTYKMKNEGIII